MKERLLVSTLAVALVASAGVVAQISQGSFEGATAGSTTMPTGWVGSATGVARIFPYQGCVLETGIGFPSQGSKWVRVDAGPQATTASYSNANNISQTFTTGTATNTFLQLDLAFITAEGPGQMTFNDFTAVTISSGTTTVQLALIDSATGQFSQTACAATSGNPATAKATISVDLLALFPSSTPSTAFTLRIYVANVGDGAVPSSAYLDNVRLGTVPPPPMSISLVNNGGGQYTFRNQAPANPGAEVYNLFSFSLVQPAGTGPVFGIAFDDGIISQVLSPIGSIPFHVLLSATGQFSLGPINIPAGLTFDAVGLRIAGGNIVEWTAPQRFTT